MSPHVALDRVADRIAARLAQRRIVRLDAQQQAPRAGLGAGALQRDIGAAGLPDRGDVHQSGPARVTETIEILLDASGEPPALRQRAGTDLFAVPSASRSPTNIAKRPAIPRATPILRVRTKTCPIEPPVMSCGGHATDRQMTAMRQELLCRIARR